MNARFCAVGLCLVGVLAATSTPAPGQSEQKRVLLLFDEDRSLPGLAALDRAVRSTLSDGLDGDVEFFAESLNAARFPAERHGQVLRDYYMQKYGATTLDLIVAFMGPAVTFLLHHGDAFAPGVPVVFLGSDADAFEGAPRPSHMTGLFIRRVFGQTLETALRLQPQTQQVFVVGGTSTFDRRLQATARAEFQPFERRVSFTYLTDLPMSELLAAVSRVPPRSVLLYLTVFRDGAGQAFVPHDVAARMSAIARVPMYVFVDQYVGLGPVGGYVYSTERHGKAGGEIALRVLRGESPAAIPIREVADNEHMFDARQLDRWKLDSGLLPAGTVIRFREPTVWTQYGVYILGAAALLAVQTILIVGLLVEHRRRRRAEMELRTSLEHIREIGQRLVGAQDTERIHIARELHDDISQKLALLKLNVHRLTGVNPQADAVADEVATSADEIVETVRDLSHRLYPPNLQLLGLAAALERLVIELAPRGRLVAFAQDNVPAAIAPDLALCLYRVTQEALQNALKHSHADNISVHLSGGAGRLGVTVRDDGVGFVVDATWGQGLGLISMADRVEAAGGSFHVRSRPHRGTTVEVSVPVALGSTVHTA